MDFMDSEESNSQTSAQFGGGDYNAETSAVGDMMEYGYGSGDSNSMAQFQHLLQGQDDMAELQGQGGKRKLEDLEGEMLMGQSDQVKEEVAVAPVNGDGGEDSEGPSPTKKPLLEMNIRKLLPELEKLWKAVDEEPNDFTAWTQLLQYVDQENEVLAAREAYDKFLGKYPYCYGYWKKYADYEKRKGDAAACDKVFRRGLKAISLSVDLWIHFLNYVKATHENEEAVIRTQFEAAITACGKEFRSDKLWEHYIQWERENNNLVNVLKIYDRLLATPTQNYQIHLQNVKELVNQNTPVQVVSEKELIELKQELAASTESSSEPLDEEAELSKLRELIIEKRTEIYKKNEAEITARWSYEEAIKRPYFHVKPLEKGQLKMWKEYLDFEIGRGDMERIIVLFERCLIACALYEEYWIKYSRYLLTESEKGSVMIGQIEDIFHRACTIHHPDKPWINLYWAAYEESNGNFDTAVQILERLETKTPNSLIICYRRINLERRRGNLLGCAQLFQHYIEALKQSGTNTANCVHLSIKYARFVYKTLRDYEKAKKILHDAKELDESTRARCTMAIVELGMEQTPVDYALVLSTFDNALSSALPEEQKVTFAHRKIEFLEDYSTDVESINKAQDELQRLAKLMREKKAATATAASSNSTSGGDKPAASDEAKNPEDSSKGAEVATTNGSAASYDQYAYGQQYNQYGNYANWNYQQSTGYGYGGQPGWNAYQGYYGGADSTTGA